MSISIRFLQAIHWKFGDKGPAVAVAPFSHSHVVAASGGRIMVECFVFPLSCKLSFRDKVTKAFNFPLSLKVPLVYWELSKHIKWSYRASISSFYFQFSFHSLVVRTSCLLSELLILNKCRLHLNSILYLLGLLFPHSHRFFDFFVSLFWVLSF